ncbi:MAG: DMT family transporter [Candidatus Hodarchaeales archaeon]|jgi:drug/metabolite transporter (DMT)-like permease
MTNSNVNPQPSIEPQIKDYALLVLAMVCWGGSWVSGKIISDFAAPLTIAFWRFVFASVFLLPALWLTSRKPLSIDKKDIPSFFFLGLTGVAIYNFLFLTGLRYTTASSGALIAGSNPVLISTFAVLFLGESRSLHKVLGILCGMVGVTLVIGVDALEGTHWEGNILIFLGMVAWASYSTRIKQLTSRYSSFELTTYGVVCGTLILFPLALLEWNSELYEPGHLHIWGGILYLAIFATCVGFVLFNRSLKRIGASRTAIFINLVPIFGSTLAILLLDETLTLLKVLGLVFVIGGVLIITQFDNSESV